MAGKQLPDDNERLTGILNYLIEFKQRNDGNSPTLREIGAAIGVNSKSLVAYYLRLLQRRDKIKLSGNAKHHSICVPGGRWIPPAA